MKARKWMAIGTLTVGLTVSTAFGETNLDSMSVKTHVESEKITATDGGKVYLGSIDLHNGGSIKGGSLDVDTTVKAGTVTAQGNGAEANLASLLLHDGSEIGQINGQLKMEATTGDVTAHEGAKINVAGIHLNDGSKINGALNIDGAIKAVTGDLVAHQGAELGVASLMMDNGSTAENITIHGMEANLQNVTVEEGAKAYFSTLKMDNSHVGTIDFKAYSKVGGDVTVPSGATLNVASAVFDNTTVSGAVNLDLHAEVGGIEMSGDSVVLVGGVNFE